MLFQGWGSDIVRDSPLQAHCCNNTVFSAVPRSSYAASVYEWNNSENSITHPQRIADTCLAANRPCCLPTSQTPSSLKHTLPWLFMQGTEVHQAVKEPLQHMPLKVLQSAPHSDAPAAGRLLQGSVATGCWHTSSVSESLRQEPHQQPTSLLAQLQQHSSLPEAPQQQQCTQLTVAAAVS